jgi:hypothetical protein
LVGTVTPMKNLAAARDAVRSGPATLVAVAATDPALVR